MKNTKKGFTLVELLVVIAILAILASVAVVGYTSFVGRANDTQATSEARQITNYINADIMANYPCKVAEGVYVTADKKVAANEDGTGAPDFDSAYVTELNSLTGKLSIDEDGNLLYTVNEIPKVVLTGVTADRKSTRLNSSH